jgi:putative hydrolase of the HAD superfamily
MPAPARGGGRLLPRPDVIFLDLGDTLVRAHPSWAGVYRQGLSEWGIDVPEDELEQALYEATQSDAWTFEGPFEATEEASYERIKRFDAVALARLGYSDLPDGAFRSIEDAFERATSWHIFADVVPAIEALDASGLRLAVISNWLWGGPELLHSLELARHFQALIISARVGYQKPHRRIFEHALEVMAVAPERAIHVGDNYQADVVGARRVGITPVLIDRHTSDPAARRAEHNEPDLPVVRDLFELIDLVGVERPAAADRVSTKSA